MRRIFEPLLAAALMIVGCGPLPVEETAGVPVTPSPGATLHPVATVPVGVTQPGSTEPLATAPSSTEPALTAAPAATPDPFAQEQSLSETGFLVPPTVQHLTETTAQIYFVLETPQPGMLFYRSLSGSSPGPVQSRPLDPSEEAHFLTLEGLNASTLYEFMVRLGSSEPLEDVPFMRSRLAPQTFRTPPYGSPLRFAVIGDTGFGDAITYALVQQMVDSEPQFVLHVGDLAYHPEDDPDPFAAFQRKFYAPFLLLWQQLPIYPTPGNHDITDRDVKLYDKALYYHVFPPFDDPQFPPSKHIGRRKWYAFEAGSVQFISLDTQVYFGEPGRLEQEAWLKERLADTRFDYSIVFFHVPPYSSGPRREEGIAVRPMAKKLERAGVPLVFAGHDHVYERLFSEPTTYITTGGGSTVLYNLDKAHSKSELFAKRSHFLLVEITSDLIEVRAITADGTVFDEVSIPTSP